MPLTTRVYSLLDAALRWVPGLQRAAQAILSPGDANLCTITLPEERSPAESNIFRAWEFDDAHGCWVPRPGSSANAASLGPRSVKMLTYNVMMDAYERVVPGIIHTRERHEAILRLLSEEEFDIVCLNEVDHDFLELLSADVFIRENFILSDCSDHESSPLRGADSTVTSPPRIPHGVLILIRREIPLLSLHALKSVVSVAGDDTKTARTSVVARVAIGGHVVAVVAVHLEAYNSRYTARLQQLQDIYNAIPLRQEMEGSDASDLRADQVIILGDFNFHQEAENPAIMAPYEDVWTMLRGDEPVENGFTWDSHRNGLIQAMWLRCDVRRMRLDRVVMAGTAPLVPKSINLFGEQTVGEILKVSDESTASLHPSDHFGLAIRFDW